MAILKMKPIYKIMFGVSAILIIIAIALPFIYGLNLSADFNGGSVMDVSYSAKRPSLDEIRTVVGKVPGVGFTVSAAFPNIAKYRKATN